MRDVAWLWKYFNFIFIDVLDCNDLHPLAKPLFGEFWRYCFSYRYEQVGTLFSLSILFCVADQNPHGPDFFVLFFLLDPNPEQE